MALYRLLVCVLALSATACASPVRTDTLRFATFNIARGLATDEDLYSRLSNGGDSGLQQVAEMIRRVRPDVLLLNEFDYRPGSGQLFVDHYLAAAAAGLEPLDYPYLYQAPVNTGVDSGLDLNGNGQTGDPEDAWGFGHFPGQYGMLVLSRFPIDAAASRSFRMFRWRDMPGALRPMVDAQTSFYPDSIWNQLRLSSKSHWDLPIGIGERVVHFLVSHPTPTVFDGPEDRNGRRNHDENRLWADYVRPGAADYLVDDRGAPGGLRVGADFVIAGDLNADPLDGGWLVDSMGQLLNHERIDAGCLPASRGGAEASALQGGSNTGHRGDPALDTSDFNDQTAGNLRIDFVLPSSDLEVAACGVFWPARDEPGHALVGASDHRLVWLDIRIPPD